LVTDAGGNGANRRAQRTRRADASPSPSAASGLRAVPQAPTLRRRQSPFPAESDAGPKAATAADTIRIRKPRAQRPE